MYQFLIYGFVGVIWLVGGVFLLKGKAVFTSPRLYMFLFLLVIIAPVVNVLFNIPEFMSESYTKTIILLLVGYFIIGVGVFIFLRARYTVINSKKSSVLSMIIDVLDEKNINNKMEDSSIKLTDYENSEILVWGFANTFEVSFKGIRKLPIYKDLVQNIKLKTKQNQEKVFPIMGLSMSIFGAILVFVSYKFILG